MKLFILLFLIFSISAPKKSHAFFTIEDWSLPMQILVFETAVVAHIGLYYLKTKSIFSKRDAGIDFLRDHVGAFFIKALGSTISKSTGPKTDKVDNLKKSDESYKKNADLTASLAARDKEVEQISKDLEIAQRRNNDFRRKLFLQTLDSGFKTIKSRLGDSNGWFAPQDSTDAAHKLIQVIGELRKLYPGDTELQLKPTDRCDLAPDSNFYQSDEVVRLAKDANLANYIDDAFKKELRRVIVESDEYKAFRNYYEHFLRLLDIDLS
ncbi:MAG: hypothetical protein V4534_04865 [Myxococcota bacterium]